MPERESGTDRQTHRKLEVEASEVPEARGEPARAHDVTRDDAGATRHDPDGDSGATRHDPDGDSGATRHDPDGDPGATRHDPDGEPGATRHDPDGDSGATRHDPDGDSGATRHDPDGDPGATGHDPDGDPGATREGPRATGGGAEGPDDPDGDPDGDPGDGDDEPVALPEPVRRRVVLLAADALGLLTPDEVPTPLRAVARFTAARRARHGGAAIAATLAADPGFRRRVAEQAARAAGPLGDAVTSGRVPAAADPAEVAALAYLIRPGGWTDLVVTAAALTRDETGRAELAARDAELERLTGQLERLRAQSRAEVDRTRAEAATLREELDRSRSRVRDLTRELRAAEAAARRATETLATERGRAAATGSATDAENRRLRSRLATAESAVAAARQAVREGRSVEDARLWLLVETIGQAAQGLRRELALSPPAVLPGDLVEADRGTGPGPATPARALGTDDPARLDQLLALPRVHLVVDGYNVTKTGYGDLSLEQQRARLVAGVAALAAQTGAEVTVVFDGAERLPAAPPAPRGVRVLFSRPGELADDVVRRLVRAEPAGRPVVVISSDREVADGVRRSGAYALASTALLRRLGRS
jgi:predicted RNA-binding protein with PIN domain